MIWIAVNQESVDNTMLSKYQGLLYDSNFFSLKDGKKDS